METVQRGRKPWTLNKKQDAPVCPDMMDSSSLECRLQSNHPLLLARTWSLWSVPSRVMFAFQLKQCCVSFAVGYPLGFGSGAAPACQTCCQGLHPRSQI